MAEGVDVEDGPSKECVALLYDVTRAFAKAVTGEPYESIREDLLWMDRYGRGDLMAFAKEFFPVLQRASSGLCHISEATDILEQWRANAEMLADQTLQERISAKEFLA